MSENTVAARQEITMRPKVGGKKVIFAASFGNALEFFDFGIYNFFVIYISVLFFPPPAIPIWRCCWRSPRSASVLLCGLWAVF